MQWFKKWDQFINENLFVNKIKDDVQSIILKCGYQTLNFADIFQSDPNQDLEIFLKTNDMLQILQEKNLRATDIEKSQDTSSLVLNPIQYSLIYNIGDTEEKNPVYLLLQVQDTSNDVVHPIQLFYVIEDISKFFEYLTNRLIVVSKHGTDKTWIYKTTNAGENWTLQNPENENNILKKEMYGDEIAELERDSLIKIEITQ
jgi:hypothetical protein